MAGTILATDSIARASRKGRPNYPIDFKRQLATLACAPNVSVSKLAAKHGINANMVFLDSTGRCNRLAESFSRRFVV